MSGASSNKEAIILIKALIKVLDARGFHLRNWRSSSRDVLINISKNLEFNEPNVEIDPENCSKALGHIWDSKDILKMNLNFKFEGEITKRSFLSESARLFDPLSWLSSPPRNWKPSVANRTSEILDIPCKQWRYVPSKENPANLGSRRMLPKDLPDCIDYGGEGPQWLSTEEAWPKQPTIKDKRDIEKSVIIETKRTLIFCILFKSNMSKQRMGDLLKDRGTRKRPFYCCGIDYAGPVSVLKYRGRGAKTKGYIVIFVCFATKALHLELVSDYTSEIFIAALERFFSRRSTPKHIHSDNGTNFIGDKRKLGELFKPFVQNYE
ncbi:DUF1758 domain-containing protein [Trichonephila clavipes]|nr:DUF1758 domain-containing protein [Trichonephila clavipes]